MISMTMTTQCTTNNNTILVGPTNPYTTQTNGRQSIEQYCRCAAAEKAQYLKVATGGNDPSITKAMRYAQNVKYLTSAPNVNNIGKTKVSTTSTSYSSSCFS